MHHIDRRADRLRQEQHAIGGFHLGQRGARPAVIRQPGLPRRDQRGGGSRHDGVVFAVDHHDHGVAGCGREHAQQRRVVLVVVGPVGGVDLDRGHAVGQQIGHPAIQLGVGRRQLGQHHVQAVVDLGQARAWPRGSAVDLGEAGRQRRPHILAGKLRREVDHRGDPAARGRARADLPVVRCLVDAGVELDVGVRVDQPGQHDAPGRIHKVIHTLCG